MVKKNVVRGMAAVALLYGKGYSMKNKLYLFMFFAVVLNVFGAGSKDDKDLSRISNEVSRDIQQTQINKGDVMVILTINNATSELSSSIITAIETALVQSNYVRIISRSYRLEAMNEIELGGSGYINDNSAARIGHFLGSKYIMLGRILNNKLTLQILEVETLLIVYSKQFDISFLNKYEEPGRFRF